MFHIQAKKLNYIACSFLYKPLIEKVMKICDLFEFVYKKSKCDYNFLKKPTITKFKFCDQSLNPFSTTT